MVLKNRGHLQYKLTTRPTRHPTAGPVHLRGGVGRPEYCELGQSLHIHSGPEHFEGQDLLKCEREDISQMVTET